jgi:hypothetical protein
MSLRDQMLKAGLITEEQARRTAHKQRVDNKRTDPKERDQRRQATRQEVQQQKEAERARDQEASRQQQHQQTAREQELQHKQHQLSAQGQAYRDGAIANWEGARRYCYAAEGRVDWLMVTDDVGRKLENGLAAIVASENNPRRHIVLAAGGARKLREISPQRVLVWHEQ